MSGKPSFLASNSTDDEGFTPEEQAAMNNTEAPEGAEPEQPEEQPTPETPETEQPEKPAKEGAEKPEHGGDLGKALREERERRRASDERAERLERTFQEAMKRLPQTAPQQGQTPPAQQQKPPAQIPDFNQDPIGYLQAMNQQLAQQLSEIRGHTQQQQQVSQQQQQYNQFVDTYRAAVTSYSRTTPDFGEAYNWLAQNATEEIKARYAGISDQEVQQILNSEEERIVAHAFKTGRNPAEAVYNFAKARGFKKDPPVPPENKLARLAAGQKAASSLSGGKNAPNGQDNLTLEHLASLSGDEFDKAWAIMERKGMLG